MPQSGLPDGYLSRKYYPKSKDIRKQLPLLWFPAALFIVGILYASGLQNHTARIFMYCVALCIPLVFMFILIPASIPKLNYVQLTAEGILSTMFGFINRTVRWSDIGEAKMARLGNVDVLGMEYKASFTGITQGIRRRRKMFGFAEGVPDAYSPDGRSLIKDVTSQLKQHT